MKGLSFVWDRGSAYIHMVKTFDKHGVKWFNSLDTLCAALDGVHFEPVTYKHVTGNIFMIITEKQDMIDSITEAEKAFVNGLFLASTEGRETITAPEAAETLQGLFNDGVSFPYSLNGRKFAYLWNDCIAQKH